MDDLARLVGERLRAARRERGLSLGALAEAAHVGKGSLSEIENGVRNPTLGTLYALAGALGVPLATLIADRPGVRVASPGIEARLLDVSHDAGPDGGPAEVPAGGRPWRSTGCASRPATATARPPTALASPSTCW